jgi:molecular chaperone DnaK
MARTKIDYGIDLGTTNSAISRMENGEPTIKKTDTLKDTMPSCVYINKKKAIQAGDSAYNALKREKLKSMNASDKVQSNAFIEFKRTMGTDKTYYSSNLEKELTSEELSSELLKSLKSFIKDESINSIVITVPAAFKNNQKEATREAAQLAGFNQIELLQEPVAASMAYGLDSNKKDGFWLVFDFGGGTFDAALLKVEEGIMKVIDTEGDNYLGGKNLDFAIVDKIIMPYLEENFVIDSILADDGKKQILRNAMKYYAEEAKIKLSFNNTHNILSDLGDIPGEDDEGEEFELDITVTQTDMSQAVSPVFQKAIDVSLDLLKRNNLDGASLDSLILVGGPTYSPVLRKMLGEQICEPDTSVDPMTVVSKGAALYASTVSQSEEIREQNRDRSKIQLEITNESSTVDSELFVPIKILEEKTSGEIPEKVYAEVIRGDKAWSSGKFKINTIGEVVEIQLVEGKTNVFNISLFDDKGNLLECEPTSFSIIQGSKIGSATLAYNFGVGLMDKISGVTKFRTLKGLEKNSSIPTVGTRNALKTQKQIRPGMDADVIKIPLYEGGEGAEGTRAIHNEHVSDVLISGGELPSLLPANSDVDLTVTLDRSEKIIVQAYFPYLDFTYDVEVERTKSTVETSYLEEEIQRARGSLRELSAEDSTNNESVEKLNSQLDEIEKLFESNKSDVDNKQQVLSNLRSLLKKIDEMTSTTEWPKLEQELKDEFYKLEKANTDLGNDKTTAMVNALRTQLDEVIRAKDVKIGGALLDEVRMLFFQLTLIYQLMAFIDVHNKNFGQYHWKDREKARGLINRGIQVINQNPSTDELHPIVIALIELLPDYEKPSGDDSVLMG